MLAGTILAPRTFTPVFSSTPVAVTTMVLLPAASHCSVQVAAFELLPAMVPRSLVTGSPGPRAQLAPGSMVAVTFRASGLAYIINCDGHSEVLLGGEYRFALDILWRGALHHQVCLALLMNGYVIRD
jgi:hypothetical protein